MRIFTITSVFLFMFGTVVFAQQPAIAIPQEDDGQPVATPPPSTTPEGRPFIERAQPGGGPWQGGNGAPGLQNQSRGQQGGQQGMGMPRQPGGAPWQPGGAPWQPGGAPWQQGGAPGPPGWRGQRPGDGPTLPGQGGGMQGPPGGMNANRVSQMISRLRTMDTSGSGTLNPADIPANQQARVNMMITQLGGNPNGPVNLAELERRALATVGNDVQQPMPPTAPNVGRPRQQTVEPLVRPFGETKPADTPVLGFGQKTVAAQQTAAGARGQASGRQQQDAAAQANQAAVQAARNANTVKQSTAYDNAPPALRSTDSFGWFFDYDTDKDGQLTMLEYVTARGGVWTQAIAAEFHGLDRNGDGFATMDEALTSIKEWDERSAKEGANPSVATPATSASPGPPPRQQSGGNQQNRLPRRGTNSEGTPNFRGNNAGARQ